ncbi:hypothetical protein B9Z55_003383 [Caenorhabditis nigoni]|uniref:DUF7154 domain-containing protein n=1 Tax=Caenorhabditis nigoni TaxID=1611254 RepID=A0A2G5VQC6_9PELO|nr:hypothetical protein B9Z55_003383 [Caenorhabditis nigoni]
MILKDDGIDQGVFVTQHYSNETLIYAANFIVSSQGTIELPPMTVPNIGIYKFLMSFKDDPVSDAFQTATLTCTNTITNKELIYDYGYNFGSLVNFVTKAELLFEGTYTMKLEYKYANQDFERLFIRIRTADYDTPPVDYWVPYDN